MPNVVKGSKQERMVVVPHRPLRRFLLAIGLMGGVAVSVAGGFAWGYYQSMHNQQTARANGETLQSDISLLRQENTELRRELAILGRSSQMDQRANEEVQQTIATLRARLAQLEQEIVYYRQVVGEESEDTGLIIGQFDISATGEPGRYRYKLVMRQQDADGDTYLTGHANVNLVGNLNNGQVVLPLRDVSENEEELDIRLRFRYFQNIEGELTLPQGFIPERVQIAAVATDPVEKSINQNFSWVVEGE